MESGKVFRPNLRYSVKPKLNIREKGPASGLNSSYVDGAGTAGANETRGSKSNLGKATLSLLGSKGFDSRRGPEPYLEYSFENSVKRGELKV